MFCKITLYLSIGQDKIAKSYDVYVESLINKNCTFIFIRKYNLKHSISLNFAAIRDLKLNNTVHIFKIYHMYLFIKRIQLY